MHRVPSLSALGLILASACVSIGVGIDAPLGAAREREAPERCAQAARFSGEPIDAPLDRWAWVEIEGARCRDGSQTGIAVRARRSAPGLLIYLEGGGACFNDATCEVNPASFGVDELIERARRLGGIFDEDHRDNPFRGWSVVYVPYCTGDLHAGSAEDVDVPGGPDDQDFVGFDNVTRALARLVPTFDDVERVVLAGSSAGGYGTLLNYHQVAEAFCPRSVALLDDSGPLVAVAAGAACVQARWLDLWHLDETLPASCRACRDPDGPGVAALPRFLARRYPEARFGLITSDRDVVMRAFYGFAASEDCTALEEGFEPLPEEEFRRGLRAARRAYKRPQWSTYVIPSERHTWLWRDELYSTTVAGVPLHEWVARLVQGEAPRDVEPGRSSRGEGVTAR